MTKYGETDRFQASDFLKILESYLGDTGLDYVVVNSKKPASARLKPFLSEKACLVKNDLKYSTKRPIVVAADLLRPRGFLRHDPKKAANIVKKLL